MEKMSEAEYYVKCFKEQGNVADAPFIAYVIVELLERIEILEKTIDEIKK
jgi:hypothetical protein